MYARYDNHKMKRQALVPIDDEVRLQEHVELADLNAELIAGQTV